MQNIGIVEAKATLSEIINRGQVVTITDHSKPVAKLIPVMEESPEFVAEMVRQAAMINQSDAADNWETFFRPLNDAE